MEELFSERIDKESRKANIIIQGLAETNSSDPKVRKASDMNDVQKIAEYLQVEASVTTCIRLGKKPDDPTEKRPLKVVLANTKSKSELIRNSKKLKKKPKGSLRGFSSIQTSRQRRGTRTENLSKNSRKRGRKTLICR